MRTCGYVVLRGRSTGSSPDSEEDMAVQASVGAFPISGLLVILLGELLLVRESLAKITSTRRRVMVFDRYRYREEDEAVMDPTVAESLKGGHRNQHRSPSNAIHEAAHAKQTCTTITRYP